MAEKSFKLQVCCPSSALKPLAWLMRFFPTSKVVKCGKVVASAARSEEALRKHKAKKGKSSESNSASCSAAETCAIKAREQEWW